MEPSSLLFLRLSALPSTLLLLMLSLYPAVFLCWGCTFPSCKVELSVLSSAAAASREEQCVLESPSHTAEPSELPPSAQR